MWKLLRRRPANLRDVEFCDTCGEVCTAACRADSVRDRARTAAAYVRPVI